MKQIKFFAVALAALTIVSCSKDNGGGAPDTSTVPGLELTITGAAKSDTRADGDKVDGVGDESRIFNLGAFVKEVIKGTDGAVKGGADGTKFVFREADYATTQKLTFGEVGVASDVYVICNYKQNPALVATTGMGDAAVVGTLYTKAQIEALIQKIEKKDLNDFSVALQTAPTAPAFKTPALATNSMLMTGTSKVPTSPMDTPDAPDKIKVEVAVERQFVKIDAGIPTINAADFKANANPTNDAGLEAIINGLTTQNDETVYYLRRTSQNLAYFDFTKSVMALPYIKDVVPNDILADGSNETPNDNAATEYRYVYKRGNDANKANMYATRNEATKNLGATSITYRIGYKCNVAIPAKTVSEAQVNAIPANTTFYRYYKAYVATDALNAVEANRKWSTGASMFYKFTNSLVGWGFDTEDGAIDSKESLGINVMVTFKKWTIREISVPME